MASYNGFEDFVLQLGKGVHQLHAAGHVLMVYLTNNVPSASADLIKTDLVGITEQNGYAAADAQNDYTEVTGTGTLACVDKEWTAAAGGFGPFQYVVLYNDTPTDPVDPLVAWWDYGSEVTCNEGEKFKVDFGASVFTIAVT